MGALITLIIIFVAVFVWYWRDSYGDFEDAICGGVFALLMTAGALIPMIVVSLFFSDAHVKVETQSISALKDNSRMGGSFFLASGSIDESDYYFYMTETADGKAREKVEVDYSYVKEGDYVPSVDIYEAQFTGKFAQWFYGKQSLGDPKYVFHVPNGSVTTEIKIDME